MVGTGTSQHAAELGRGDDPGRRPAAHAVSAMQFVDWAPLVGPQDGVVVITHTAETAYALSARALAFDAGLGPVMITKRGAGFPDAIETVEKETSETYTVSYTTAVLALAMLAHELGAEHAGRRGARPCPGGRRRGDRRPGDRRRSRSPSGCWCSMGAGPSAVTAREGALKVREAARFLAEGYDAEYLLHGSAVPLDRRRPARGALPTRPDGFVEAVAHAGELEGVPVTRLVEPADLPVVLAQIPLTARLQLLALRFAVGARAGPGHGHHRRVGRRGALGDRRAVGPTHGDALSDRTNSRTAASSRSPTRARTTVPSPSVSVPSTSASR